MRTISILLLLTILFLFSCEQGGLKDFTTSSSGLVYKHHIKTGAAKANPGDKVYYHIDFRKDDSIVTSSRREIVPIELTIPEADDGNYLREMILMMSKGDSMTMVRHKDSVKQKLPVSYEDGDLIYIDLVLKDIMLKADVVKEKETLLSAFKPSENGFLMNKIVDTKGKKPKPGDGITYSLVLNKGQKKVYSSFDLKRDFRLQIPPEGSAENRKKNPIMDALCYMALGDSMHMAIEFDSMRNQVRPEWGFQSGDVGLFQLKTLDIVPKSEVDKQIAEQKKQEEKRAKLQEANKSSVLKRYDSVKKDAEKTIADYKANKLDLKTTSSGLKYLITQKGSGANAVKGSTVSVHYSGHLTDGTEFDSSFGRGDPIKFPLGMGRVIKGWDEGIALLNPGSKAYLFIPSELGYGETGSPPKIQPNSELVFYVELMQAENNSATK